MHWNTTEHKPLAVENETGPFCIPPSCGQILMRDEHRGLPWCRPASAVRLHLVEGPLRDVLQHAVTDLHQSLEPAHSARCCMKRWGEARRGVVLHLRYCDVGDVRAQHMNASSPVSVLARATVIALRHDGRKLKPIERDNCQSSIFDLFDIYTLKYCFSLFAMTSVRLEKMDWSKLLVSWKSITSLQWCYVTFLADTFVQLLSLADSLFHCKIYGINVD